jgi:hypothetical protein
MVPPVLRAWIDVEAHIDTETILAGPFDGFEEIFPRNFRKVGFVGIRLDGLKWHWDANPVETSGSNHRKIFFNL